MNCPHCEQEVSLSEPFDYPVEHGIAYSQKCPFCHHVLGIRPRLVDEPEPPSEIFNDKEVGRMEFAKWRLKEDIKHQKEKITA